MRPIDGLIILGILVGLPITILVVRDRMRRKREPGTGEPPEAAARAPFGWRVLRGLAILFYAFVMGLLMTSVAMFFFPHVFPPLAAILQALVDLSVVVAALLFLRIASRKVTAASTQPEVSYDGGLIVILLAGVAAWAWLIDSALLGLSSIAFLITLIGGLYVLFKMRAFRWKNYLVAGLAIGLGMAATTLPAMATAKKKAEAIRAQREAEKARQADGIAIRVSEAQWQAIQSLPDDLFCLTSASNPIRSLTGLKDDEFAAWVTSPQIPQKLMAAFGRADTVVGLRIIGTGNEEAGFIKDSKLRLFITHEPYAADIIKRGGVRIRFEKEQ